MVFGETAEQTVIREVYEETGLRVIPEKPLDTWNYIVDNYQITGVIFLCRETSTETVVLSDEHDRYEWLAPVPASFELMNRLFRPQMVTWDWGSIRSFPTVQRGVSPLQTVDKRP